MKKERIIATSLVGVLSAALILAVGNMDVIYIGSTLFFFALCAAYAAWCERL